MGDGGMGHAFARQLLALALLLFDPPLSSSSSSSPTTTNYHGTTSSSHMDSRVARGACESSVLT